jgi:hypothetical protein
VSLVELVVALALFGVVGGLALRAIAMMGRHAVAVSEHATAGGSARTGLLLLQSELRALGGDPSGSADLVRITADSVTYRAIRGAGVTCAVAAAQVRIRNAAPIPFGGLRAIAPGRDSLLLFVEGDPASPLDDRWIRVPVTSVGSAVCGGVPAIAVGTPDFTAALPSGDLSGVVPGGPVLTFEVMRLAEYLSGGLLWLGTASVSAGEVIQPVAGPLAGSGLTLEYLSELGASVVDPAAVRRVRATLIGGTERPVGRAWSGGPMAVAAETLGAEIFLRNTPR